MKKYKTMSNAIIWQDGQKCVFKFLGATCYGVVNEKNERLTREYNEPWYWVYETTTGTRYPICYKDIIATR